MVFNPESDKPELTNGEPEMDLPMPNGISVNYNYNPWVDGFDGNNGYNIYHLKRTEGEYEQDSANSSACIINRNGD